MTEHNAGLHNEAFTIALKRRHGILRGLLRSLQKFCRWWIPRRAFRNR